MFGEIANAEDRRRVCICCHRFVVFKPSLSAATTQKTGLEDLASSSEITRFGDTVLKNNNINDGSNR